MKKIVFAALVALVSTSAFAGGRYFKCEGFGNVDEYRSSIDLKKKSADFFDNDTTSDLKLTKVGMLESLPPQWQYTFEGKDESSEGSILRLIFNRTKLTASIYSISEDGKSTKIGSTDCKELNSSED